MPNINASFKWNLQILMAIYKFLTLNPRTT